MEKDAGMEQNWTVTVWGTRGAVPMASAGFLEFGGNTSCVCADCGGELAVFDAGTGIVGLGSRLARRSGRKKLHLFISHLHLDHIIGLTGFQTLYDPSAEIHLYGERQDGLSILDRLGRVLNPPYWPVGPGAFTAKIFVHDVEPGQRLALAEGLHVDALRGNHPNLSLLYRLEGGGRRLVYALDCEMGGGMEERLTEFARDCDLLIWDSNFIPGEVKPGWGHSTWEEGLAAGRAAGAKRVLMTHYCREYNDQFLREQELAAQKADGSCIFAREGMVIEL